MARVREFNESIALDKAIELFWQKGYANASMREMVKHTGVAHAGLYTAFGDKDRLFKAALERYEQGIFTYLFAGLESERAGLKEIKKFFDFVCHAKGDKYFKNGCFIANTATEFGKNEGPIHEILKRTFERQVEAFRHALSNAAGAKQINTKVKINETAFTLTALFYGCSSLIRMKAPDEAVQMGIDGALAVLQ